MSYLLDTNVVSEWVKARPDPGVIRWLQEVDEDRVFIATVTLAELRYGIERLASGRRRQHLEEWLISELRPRFSGRILALDEAVADAWGELAARRDKKGRRVSPIDGFIAATATVHNLIVITRNISDFEDLGVDIFDPWS